MFNVLSLFDGISCARIALDRANINVNNYYASEIDKFARIVSEENYPDIIHLGDINYHASWDLPEINLMIAGYPCQSWSIAGDQKGINDPRGKLAITTDHLYRKYNPDFFLFENVASMSKANREYLDNLFGVKSVEINSSLFSGQRRSRLYWTNIPIPPLPEDKGIKFSDVIEDGYVHTDKAYCLDACYYKTSNAPSQVDYSITRGRRSIVFDRPYSKEDYNNGRPVKHRRLTPEECEKLQTIPVGYTKSISNTQRYKSVGNSFTVDVIAHILRGLYT